MMVNMQKRCLVLLLAQHKHDSFRKLKNPQQEEEPQADLNFQPLIFVEKTETFAPPNEAEVKAEVVGSHNKNCACDDLENVVKTKPICNIIRQSIFHELWANNENNPQVKSDETQKNYRENLKVVIISRRCWKIKDRYDSK